MKIAPWLVIACLGVFPSGASEDIEISGTALDADGGKPIRHVTVTATSLMSKDMQHPDVLTILTDDEGRFLFAGLPAGRYNIRGHKTGYTHGGNYSETFDHSTNVMLKFTQWAAITGTVRDDRGLPVAGACVGVYGATIPFDGPGSATDIDGTFRIPALPHTPYRIRVFSPGSGTLLRTQGLSFAPVYYPGTAKLSEAVPVELAPGQEFQVDLRITPVPGLELRGRAEVPGILFRVFVHPVASENYYMVWGLEQHDRKSREFRVSRLAPGVYVLEVDMLLDPSSFVSGLYRKTIQVSDADVANVVVSLADQVPGR